VFSIAASQRHYSNLPPIGKLAGGPHWPI